MSEKFFSIALIGLDAVLIEVEADISRATLPVFKVVGLPDTSVREAQERIRAAIKNSGLPFPQARITVNLAPAHIKKEGSMHDLAMTLAIISATGGLTLPNQKRRVFLGELALDGSLRPFIGALPAVLAALENQATEVYFPAANREEVALALDEMVSSKINALPAKSVTDVLLHLTGVQTIKPMTPDQQTIVVSNNKYPVDFAHVHGQALAKRALEIAAAGSHNVLMTGPPGSGKTMLARALPSIFPPMTREEALEVIKIRSVTGKLNLSGPNIERPFRSPHHTSSCVALIGGGSWPAPGEVSLAHRGVLFLDEFPEFPRHVLEALRQPLEDGFVTISRAQCTLRFQARFSLVAARNPCPCGYASDPSHDCTCQPTELLRYQRKISGPLLERIDLHLKVPRVDPNELLKCRPSETSDMIRQRVIAARNRMSIRLSDENAFTNADMDHRLITEHCSLNNETENFLCAATDRLKLSARSVKRTLKVARTIADLSGSDQITQEHLAEALQFRSHV
ncbi:YifB family Mg chelatase-like AAA ATPase [Patescibacteria group bacterium]|nr:YifB family Mg chelatase-like AAA ATPase [Patescibacteria group bacterium]MBU1029117.1 YifB family Mg chelatase-like AAA ATPase [Patescibacteria group bacterium]MBU1915586.1 YifB family Mg chelatase-like AAA ATPase [Patescibacteria group bacterium]